MRAQTSGNPEGLLNQSAPSRSGTVSNFSDFLRTHIAFH
jgi:hypothetical protein